MPHRIASSRFLFARPVLPSAFFRFAIAWTPSPFGQFFPLTGAQKSPLRRGLFNTQEDFYFFSLLPINSGMLPSLCAPSRPLRL